MSALDRAQVLTDQGACGELSRDGGRDYLFRYGIGIPDEAQISLTMAVRDMPYLYRTLHPVFQMNLPEGYVLEQLRHRLAKTTTLNPMLLLALTGSGSPIGRVQVQSPALDRVLDRGTLPRGERLSCMVGNGDAHLKNFGLLYADPLGTDAKLSPAYDIVNTTAYIPEDALALTLAGSKSLFRSRLGILDLAKTCDVVQSRQRLRELIAAVDDSLSANAALAEEVPQVCAAIAHANGSFRQTFAG